ncbi:MAG: hypothetical protein ACFFB5_11705 [Promethearchaeota archaeon]
MSEKLAIKETYKSWNDIIKIASIAVFIQLAYLAIVFAIEMPLSIATDYLPLDSASDYFNMINNDRLAAIFLMDLPMVAFMICNYFTSLGIFAVLRKRNEALISMFTAFIFISTTMGLIANEIFSLFYLSDRYAAASTDALKEQLLAAGEAVLANSLWHNTAGYVMGILFLGSFLMISMLMLQSNEFKKRTVISGILATGLDLFQHAFHIFLPSISAPLLLVAGIFYIPWYIFLGLDLLRLGRSYETNM